VVTSDDEPQDLARQLDAAAATGIVEAALAAERAEGLPQGLLVALSLRETGCRDVVGGGGHRRGAFGIDDRRDREWLVGIGSSRAGAIPPLEGAAHYVAGVIGANVAFARANQVHEAELLRFALAAYAAGTAAALEGYRLGDPDTSTPGEDYGRDVLHRLDAIAGWLAHSGRAARRPTLEPGARGEAVVEAKRLLRSWYASRGLIPPRRMRGPAYGTGAVAAVREFQREHGLEPTGVVDPETWRALAGEQARREASSPAA
jgi:hypothetical protein